jgi:anti-anti-sigma factor
VALEHRSPGASPAIGWPPYAQPDPELSHDKGPLMDRFAASVGQPDAGRVVVTVSGELDLGTADKLWADLEPLIIPRSVVVLDGNALNFLDSSGLRVLLRAGNRAAREGAAFRLVAPHPAVQRVLELAGTAGHLETRGTVEEALAG